MADIEIILALLQIIHAYQIWSRNYKKSQISQLFLSAQIISGSYAPRLPHYLHVWPYWAPRIQEEFLLTGMGHSF